MGEVVTNNRVGTDGWVYNIDTNFTVARGDASTTGTSSHFTMASYPYAITAKYAAGRTTNDFQIRRSFFDSRVHTNTKGHVLSATLNVYLENISLDLSPANVVIPVLSTALAGNSGDFGNIFVPPIGSILPLAGPQVVGGVAGYDSFPLSAQGLSLLQESINTSTTFSFALIDYNYDALNTQPSLGGDYTQIDAHFQEYTGSTRDPYIECIIGNGLFFGANF